MGKIVRAEVHRLVIVDDEEHVVGIVSLSDILTFLVLKPLGKTQQCILVNIAIV